MVRKEGRRAIHSKKKGEEQERTDEETAQHWLRISLNSFLPQPLTVGERGRIEFPVLEVFLPKVSRSCLEGNYRDSRQLRIFLKSFPMAIADTWACLGFQISPRDHTVFMTPYPVHLRHQHHSSSLSSFHSLKFLQEKNGGCWKV